MKDKTSNPEDSIFRVFTGIQPLSFKLVWTWYQTYFSNCCGFKARTFKREITYWLLLQESHLFRNLRTVQKGQGQTNYSPQVELNKLGILYPSYATPYIDNRKNIETKLSKPQVKRILKLFWCWLLIIKMLVNWFSDITPTMMLRWFLYTG